MVVHTPRSTTYITLLKQVTTIQVVDFVVNKKNKEANFQKHSMLKTNEYIEKNGLAPISAGFIVTINEVTDMKDVDKFEVDVYIFVSPNVA